MEVPKNPPGHSVSRYERTGRNLGPNEMRKEDLELVNAGKIDKLRSLVMPIAQESAGQESRKLNASLMPGQDNIGKEFLGL